MVGNLPFRLQDQDNYDIVIDIGERPIRDLKMVGIVDGSGRWWNASDVEVAVIVQQSTRYDNFKPKRDTTELEERLKQCDIEINAAVQDGPTGRKRLEITFTNKSDMPIQLNGGEIKWEYDPPRWHPDAGEGKPKIAEAGGSVKLACAVSLKSPVAPGDTATFYVHDDIACVLVETIVGDVKDKDIKVILYTDTKLAWTATEDEIPGAIREIAQHIVDTRHPPT